MQAVRGEFVLLWHIEVFCRSGNRIYKPEVRSLSNALFSLMYASLRQLRLTM